MKFKYTLVVICFIGLVSPVNNIHAQTASPSGTIRESVKQKVQEELSRIQKAVARKGFTGSVTAKSDASLTITTTRNQSRSLILTTETVIKLSGGKDGTIADIKSNDFILAMGEVDSQNTMNVKRLLVITPPAPDRRAFHFGKITSLGNNTLTIQTPKNETLEFKAIAATKYNDKLKFSDLKTNANVIIISTSTTSAGKTSYTALNIHALN